MIMVKAPILNLIWLNEPPPEHQLLRRITNLVQCFNFLERYFLSKYKKVSLSGTHPEDVLTKV